jgi:hypothetical protein
MTKEEYAKYSYTRPSAMAEKPTFPTEQERKRELAGLGLKAGATFIPSLDGFAISENDLANVIKERDEARTHADKLAEALRDCITAPGALAERSHEYALRRLATITATAREALAAYESKVQ